MKRSERKDRKRSLLESAAALRNGGVLFIYPEGTTRHASVRKLGEFYDGAFRLAVETGAPIVPITIMNTARALSNDGRFLARPFVGLRAIVDPPIETKDMTEADAEELKRQVRDLIQRNLDEYYAGKRRAH